MAAIDDITSLAQDTYYSINGEDSTATGANLTTFQNQFIRAFNLWLDEYETETYWDALRTNDFVLATVNDTTTFSFPFDTTTYRTIVVNPYKYLKVVATDGSTVLANFKIVDSNQIINDDPADTYHPDRAILIGTNVVLSRPLKTTELGSTLVLDVVAFHPRLSTTDSTGIGLLPSRQLAVLGVAKNMTLANVVKVALSASFVQKYNDELQKQIAINNASTANYSAQYDNYGYVTGSW